jgi:hypothetical protein
MVVFGGTPVAPACALVKLFSISGYEKAKLRMRADTKLGGL